MRIATVAISLLLATTVSLAPAQSAPAGNAAQRASTPAEPDAIALYLDQAAAPNHEVWTTKWGELWARNVTRATLTPVLPDPAKASGAAVLVVPGGGFQFVSMSNEGWPIARWLADRGIAAFVLKYRTASTPDDEVGFDAAMEALFNRLETTPTLPEDNVNVTRAREDAQAALRLIRANSAKWGVDPKRVGMLGFSAGAMTTLATVEANAADARPDFIASIYGFMTPVTPPPQPQPMFAALAADDPLFGKQGFGLIESWQRAGGSTELHFYSSGGHGFGSKRTGKTSDGWFWQFVSWMEAQGLLKQSE